MARTVAKAIQSLREQQDALAHGTLKNPPKTLEGVYKAHGEYIALEKAIAELRGIQVEADGDES